MNIKEIINKVEPGVKRVLHKYPETRRNDLLLILFYWTKIQRLPIPKDVVQRIKQDAVKPETIRRVRQKVQEMGLYLPERDIVSARQQSEFDWREYGRSAGDRPDHSRMTA